MTWTTTAGPIVPAPRPASPAEVLGPLALPAPTAAALEELLAEAAASPSPDLAEALARTVRRPSKRLRPGLLLAVAELTGTAAEPALLRRAAAVELLHLGSLVHDDLMDRSHVRGGAPTVYATHRAEGAVVGGDRLLAAAGLLLADAGPEVHRVWHQAFLAMCDGQALETAQRHRLGTPAAYLRQVHGKTAALISAACVLGALPVREAAGGTRRGGTTSGPGAARALARYGACFGVVFQIADDLADVLATPESCGKPVRQDIPRGVYTLPVLLAARGAGGSGLAGVLREDAGDAETAHAYETVRRLGVPPAVAVARAWAERARRALVDEGFADPAARLLARLPAHYLDAALPDGTAHSCGGDNAVSAARAAAVRGWSGPSTRRQSASSAR
ncbi:polyprenyl synthetase family protein [Streptacidiphilus jiangxiensis]|uniref:Heptaprenyl diphosphate synthase n=1 Tax=Streptacidiphilus jiangxiensis TaxID=235985 RepID=A0A1H7WHJ6_STRJI|nr:polyprenyl synthetase family protein [Streptacidiphilus jiangxiensis]SEM21056.1 heptaprenyl diphosphate synthase [Streptacidiphilus jiangxiensis]